MAEPTYPKDKYPDVNAGPPKRKGTPNAAGIIGKVPGVGRPKGSKNKKPIYSQDSVEKLEELDFDPIEKMVHQYRTLEKQLAIPEGKKGHIRVGSGAYAQIYSTMGQLINNLMQYGYRKVTETSSVEVNHTNAPRIVLTTKADLERERANAKILEDDDD